MHYTFQMIWNLLHLAVECSNCARLHGNWNVFFSSSSFFFRFGRVKIWTWMSSGRFRSCIVALNSLNVLSKYVFSSLNPQYGNLRTCLEKSLYCSIPEMTPFKCDLVLFLCLTSFSRTQITCISNFIHFSSVVSQTIRCERLKQSNLCLS